METPKTVNDYLVLISKVERISVQSLKDFDKQSKDVQETLSILEADISNAFFNVLYHKQGELKEQFRFICFDCRTIHKMGTYAIAQTAQGVAITFTCKCGNKILL